MDIESVALEIGEAANGCCYRSDGFEESVASFARERLRALLAAERKAVLDLVDAYAKGNTDLADAIRARGDESTSSAAPPQPPA